MATEEEKARYEKAALQERFNEHYTEAQG